MQVRFSQCWWLEARLQHALGAMNSQQLAGFSGALKKIHARDAAASYPGQYLRDS
jgi:hypothetical protein